MGDLSGLGLITAFAAGAVSFLSPCVLPLVPAYVSYVAGQSLHGTEMDAHTRAKAAAMSVFFILGFGMVFIALGAGATALGGLLLRYRYEANVVGGVIVVLFGLFMLGLARHVSWFHRDLRLHPRLRGGNPGAAFVLGLAFGFGWTPCIGPVLGAILTVSAVENPSSSASSPPMPWGWGCRSCSPRCSCANWWAGSRRFATPGARCRSWPGSSWCSSARRS